jgi:4-hydroxythreonine-4-phosphate dehydrogenase
MRWSNITERIAPLAVSLGDPAGVGPELICEAWIRRGEEGLPPFFVTGGLQSLRGAAETRGLELPLVEVEAFDSLAAVFSRALPVVRTADAAYRPGVPTARGAQMAIRSLEAARCLAQARKASAVVTGPVSKDRLAAEGFKLPGQTEYFAAVCSVPEQFAAPGEAKRYEAVMMLAGPSLRTVPLTVHCALSEVPGLITQDLIIRRARIVAHALRTDFGIAAPRIAICGLNPHAGESGRMGREEIEVIAPAIEQLRAEGIDASGPHPADSLFAPRARETYDVALAMYHDQALVPLKALDFDQGVNVTLGLPIVRTSPDHGTAFDIAGKGIADPGAMIAAIRMAGEIAARRAAAR